jgi:hypothetical protein
MFLLGLVGTTLACEYGAGDAWRAVPVRGPDGRAGWWSIECTYHATDCYVLAARVCPTGYVTQSSTATSASESRGVATASGNLAVARTNTTVYSGRSMFIHCSPPKVAPPPTPQPVVVAAPVPVETAQVQADPSPPQVVRENPF